jgi:hypothetical protein
MIDAARELAAAAWEVFPCEWSGLETKSPLTYRGGDGAGLVRTVAEANEDDRHDALVWASYRARNDGILREITEELVAAAVAAGGETETSARRLVASVRRSAS